MALEYHIPNNVIGYLGEDYLWVTGGYKDDQHILNSTDAIFSHKWTVWRGPNLPMPLALHAMININKTTTLVIGGQSMGITSSNRTFYFNHETKKWQNGPQLATG